MCGCGCVVKVRRAHRQTGLKTFWRPSAEWPVFHTSSHLPPDGQQWRSQRPPPLFPPHGFLLDYQSLQNPHLTVPATENHRSNTGAIRVRPCLKLPGVFSCLKVKIHTPYRSIWSFFTARFQMKCLLLREATLVFPIQSRSQLLSL